MYLTVKCSWKTQCRAESQDNQSQFPAFDEADDAGREEVGVGLDQHAYFITDPLLDLIDVTVHTKISMSMNYTLDATLT